MTPRTVMITGASRGLGRALALAFAPQAGRLILAARSAAHLAATAAEVQKLHSQCSVLVAGGDLGTRVGIEQLEAEVGRERLGTVDILVNNAGWARPAALAEASPVDVIATYYANIIAPTLLCRAVVGGMARRGWGRIINISSITAVQAPQGLAPYTAAKAGLNALTRCLSAEVGCRGVTVNAIMPGLMLTDMGREAVVTMEKAHTGLTPEAVIERLKRAVPLRKLTEVSEVAALARYLAGEEAGFITGQVIGAAGGR